MIDTDTNTEVIQKIISLRERYAKASSLSFPEVKNEREKVQEECEDNGIHPDILQIERFAFNLMLENPEVINQYLITK